MSRRFRQQDYFRYKRLGTRWRKPRGRQSKLRIRKGGAGRLASVGYGTEKAKRDLVRGSKAFVVRNVQDVQNVPENAGIIISAGLKKTAEICSAAKGRGLVVLNMKKARKAARKAEKIKAGKAKAPEGKKEEKRSRTI